MNLIKLFPGKPSTVFCFRSESSMGGYEPIFIQPILTLSLPSAIFTNHKQNVRKVYIQTFLLEQDARKQLRACPPFLLLPVYIPSRERTHKDRLPVIIPARDRKSNMVIQCKNLISLYILPDQRRVNLLVFYKSQASNKFKLITFRCSKEIETITAT